MIIFKLIIDNFRVVNCYCHKKNKIVFMHKDFLLAQWNGTKICTLFRNKLAFKKSFWKIKVFHKWKIARYVCYSKISKILKRFPFNAKCSDQFKGSFWVLGPLESGGKSVWKKPLCDFVNGIMPINSYLCQCQGGLFVRTILVLRFIR